MRTSQRGFTLAEVMVALAVFSVIGLGCWQVSDQLLRTKRQLDERSARLRELQRGLWIVSRDINQVVDRTARDSTGMREPALTSLVPGQALTLTRGGWTNPMGERRSHLQRVTYGLERDASGTTHLVRHYWTSPDRNRYTPQHRQILIQNVDYLEIQFLDDEGTVHFHWPLQASGRAGAIPAGIRLRFHAAPFGEMEKLFSLRGDGPEP